MFQLNSNGQWGTYHVGDRAFFSKLEAVSHSRNIGQPVVWKYQHTAFSKQNWTCEPSQTLWELYSNRAHQLRTKYSYIMLMYSGGADSTNVLDVFERNNIPIDEVRLAYAGEISDPASLHLDPNREIYHAALPRVRRLQHKWPHLKVTVVNMKPLMIDRVCNHAESLHFGTNSAWNPWQGVRFGISMLSDMSWLPQLTHDRQLAILWGKDKTKVVKIKNRYAVQFTDTDLHGNIELLPDNCQHEYFYWTPDSVDIAIKQGHVLKNFFRLADNDPQWFDHNKKFLLQDSSATWLYQKIDIAGRLMSVNNACYNTLVYPYYDPMMVDTGKAEWIKGISPIVVDTFYQDQNLRQTLNQYMKQKMKDYRGYYDITDRGAFAPTKFVDQPWFLEA